MRIAVLIDADNISASHAPKVFPHAAKLGTAVIRRLYGRPSSITAWEAVARDEFCEMRPLANLGPAKNGTDIALAVDAMDIFHEGVVGAFCIVSNDRDFVPLARRLRAAGKGVHAICLRSDERYLKVFDSVLDLEASIVGAFRAIIKGRGPELSLSEAGKLLREHSPGLIPTSGKASLRKALEASGAFELIGSGPGTRVRLLA